MPWSQGYIIYTGTCKIQSPFFQMGKKAKSV